MTIVDLPAFYLGVSEELEKHANLYAHRRGMWKNRNASKMWAKLTKVSSFNLDSMPVNENIIPNVSSQAKWKYVRTKDGLKLSDGNLVYSFGGLPEELPAEDSRVSRISDDNILNFENDALSKGTAQIHRASPDNIYMTLADGSHNPTFMLQHEQGKDWRYSPSKKFMEKLKAMKLKSEQDSIPVDVPALMEGAQDVVKQAYAFDPSTIGAGAFDATSAADAIKALGHGAAALGGKYITAHAAHPITSTALGYGGSKMFSHLLDRLDFPNRQIRRMVDPMARTGHELWPVASSVLPTLASGAIMAK